MKEVCKSSSLVLFHHSLSHVQLFATPWAAARQASLSFTFSMSLQKFIPFKSVMQSNYLVLCCPLLLPPSIFPNIRVFLMSQLFPSGGQSTEASASVLPINIQDWFPLGLTHLISLQPKVLSRVFSNTIFQKDQFFSAQPSSSFFFFFPGNIFLFLSFSFSFFCSFIFISWRLITLQYCSSLCHTLTCFRKQHWNMYIISLLYDPILTAIHDYCENHSFD